MKPRVKRKNGHMEREFDLQAYLTRGVEHVVSDALCATLKNPRESAFMLRFAAASRAASKRREEAERRGEHIPAFLIASITSRCNLHCAGCYSRCNHATTDEAPARQLNDSDWRRIFDEAGELGVSFILLAGGEPLLRQDVIEAAGERQDILFPIFTNGTYMDEAYFQLFDRRRNLVPIMSIEGSRRVTDARRGDGVYDRLMTNMDELKKRGLIFGVSVTVTTENLDEVSSDEFIRGLSERGCKAVIFVEFVPVTEDARHLAPGDDERERLRGAIERLRTAYPETLLLCFPGDEKSSGGCIAAGRGFFHINSHGGAEPCPFSPYSDMNVGQVSLREALNSPLFRALREGGLLLDDHAGGCVLYERRADVEKIISGQA